jgi:hypothetical protein
VANSGKKLVAVVALDADVDSDEAFLIAVFDDDGGNNDNDNDDDDVITKAFAANFGLPS